MVRKGYRINRIIPCRNDTLTDAVVAVMTLRNPGIDCRYFGTNESLSGTNNMLIAVTDAGNYV